MLFNSLEFLLFFPIVTVLYYVLPHNYRWALLLIASCVFYMFFKAVYILILLFTIVIDYWAGIFIEQASDPKKRKLFLLASLVANIGILAIFKYYNFLNGNISGLLNWCGFSNPIPYLNILLPIGLSFHTFQAMSYTIEVYRGHQKAERHFGIYSLYVMFYPQLVAGPIERPQNLLPQFHEKKYFKYDNVSAGLKLILWGFFKKVVISDRLAVLVNTVYGDLHHYSGIPLIIAAVFFSYQIYCDFSGYSDIAIGTAKVMGFDLMINFKTPYFSKSVTEFWSRWHISLSTWFKDYLYIPLGGNRVSLPRWSLNILLVFVISGLWHGANWTFIIWGALHGVLLLTERYSSLLLKFQAVEKKGWLGFLLTLKTFSLVTLAWVFFRANTLSDAMYVITHVFTNLKFQLGGYNMGLDAHEFYLAIFFIVVLETVQYIQTRGISLGNFSSPFRWAMYYLLIITLMVYSSSESSQFIYFQF